MPRGIVRKLLLWDRGEGERDRFRIKPKTRNVLVFDCSKTVTT